MDNQYGNNENFNNGYYTYNENDMGQFTNGFESGAGVVKTVKDFKALLCEEVIAKSFLFMVIGLLITAVTSLTITPDRAYTLLSGYNFLLVVFAELAIVFISNWAIRKNHAVIAGILYTVYAYLTGVTLSIIFMAYTMTSIASVFFITAGMFLVMAVYGLITKTDLTRLGNLFLMALIGLIIASVVNLFILHSGMFDLIVSGIGVIIFVGLVAYDTQKIKNRVAFSNDGNVLCLALFGAFELYLDFINIFLKLLRLFGKRK